MKNLLLALIGLSCFLYACNKEIVSTEASTTGSIEKSALSEAKQEYSTAAFDENIYSNNQRMVSSDCAEETGELNCSDGTRTYNLSVPGYCQSVRVEFDLEICTDPNNPDFIQYTISNLQAEPFSSCTEFYDIYNSLPFPEAIEYYEAMEYAASLAAEAALAIEYFDNVPTAEFLEVLYYRDLCYKWEYVEGTSTPTEPGGNTYPIWLSAEKLFCGSQCCLRETTYIFDNGSPTPTAPSTFTTVGDCDSRDQECINSCGAIEYEG